MKKLGGGIVITEISVYDAEIERLTGVETNEWRPMHLNLSEIVTLRVYASKDPILDGLPIISCSDSSTYILNELHEDVLEEWINHKKI
jgi:hypothetical protein